MPEVYPVFDNKFKIGIKGPESTESDKTLIKGMTNFAPNIESGIEQWNTMEDEGWGDAMMTSKKLSFSFSGKRVYGDPGNDYVASLAWKSGNSVISPFEWELPSGAKVTFNSIINVTTPAGGDSTAVDGLEFEVHCKGKPKFTEANAEVSPTKSL